jgi:putative hemolysin
MDTSLLVELLVLLLLVLANGVLAGAEIAIVSVRGSRVRELAEAGNAAGRALRKLRAKPERFLSTVQIGITVIGATAGAFGGATFAADLEPAIARIPGLEARAHTVALVLAVGVISYLSVVLGELVPKSLALRTSERYARLVARPLLSLSWIMQPVVWLLARSSNLVLRLFGDATSFVESRLSLQELRTIVDEASEEGSVPVTPGQIASRALQLAELTAEDVMIHRRFVVSLAVDADEAEQRRVLAEIGHRRTPVHGESLDDLLGYVSWHDVLRARWEGAPIALRDHLRPAHFVPEAMPAADLLETMRKERLHLAFVADEHGGVAGIVTIEDLLEELVGEIDSEHDPRQPLAIRRQPDGWSLVNGTTPVRDVNRELDLRLEEPEGGTTIGWLCTVLADGRIPQAGERFTAADGTLLEVVEASPRRVRKVRVRRRVESAPEQA